MLRVGVLSDTHGVLRPVVLERLAGCDLLLHAGDVGEPAPTSPVDSEPILARLERLAPVVAVRGNWDSGALAAALPAVATGDLGGMPYRMTHRREDIPADWPRQSRLIVFGHSHRPELEWRGDCLLLNPGGCGARRFRLPLTIAVVTVADNHLVPEILAVE
jgi:putative phosphoesterase